MTKLGSTPVKILSGSAHKRLLHKSRAFDRLPGPSEAQALLLTQIGDMPCLFAPVTADKPLTLYGGGNLGRLARDFLRAVGYDFTAVIDRNADILSKDSRWSGVQLFKPGDIPQDLILNTRIAVSVTTSPYVPLEQTLRALGFKDIVPFYDLAESFRHIHPLSNGWFAPAFTAEDRNNTSRALDNWFDDTSRAHHLQFLAWRRLREEWTFDDAPVQLDNRFFIPEIVEILGQDETFVDIGAHNGSVSLAFVERVGRTFQQIVAIEPDTINNAELAATFDRHLDTNSTYTILSCVLGEGEGEVVYHEGLGYASQISTTGANTKNCIPLDAIDLTPSFIKLHLEGGELAALKGALLTLRRSRPIIATTVYHNADGIWKTALWLNETLPNYRLLFRTHSWCGTGAVIYAIPNERAMLK